MSARVQPWQLGRWSALTLETQRPSPLVRQEQVYPLAALPALCRRQPARSGRGRTSSAIATATALLLGVLSSLPAPIIPAPADAGDSQLPQADCQRDPSRPAQRA